MTLAGKLLGPTYYDEIAIAERVLPDSGFMVDVGAHHGGALRNFANKGWSVLALEPDPQNRAVLESVAPDSVQVDDRAVSEVDGDTVSFYTSDVSSGISTLAPFHESHSASVTVQTVRLDTLLQANGSPEVTFLKVDTEGFDLPVLRTFPWAEQRPDVVVCEFEDRKTVPLGYSYRDLGAFLAGQGYSVLMSEWHPIVEYGMSHSWRRVAKYPQAQAADRGWGNFIATKPELARRTELVARAAGMRLGMRTRVDRMRARG